MGFMVTFTFFVSTSSEYPVLIKSNRKLLSEPHLWCACNVAKPKMLKDLIPYFSYVDGKKRKEDEFIRKCIIKVNQFLKSCRILVTFMYYDLFSSDEFSTICVSA